MKKFDIFEKKNIVYKYIQELIISLSYIYIYIYIYYLKNKKEQDKSTFYYRINSLIITILVLFYKE